MSVSKNLIAVLCAGACLVVGGPAVAQDAESLLVQAQNEYRSGDWTSARSNFEKAYNEAADDSPIKAQAIMEWSSLLWEQGDYAQAQKRADQALELAKELELNAALGRLLLTRGHIEASRGQLRSAEDTLKLCVELAKGPDDEVFAALCKLNHRLVRQMRGRPAGPDSDYRKAIAKLESAGTAVSVGTSMAKTAELYDKNGNSERALELLMKAQKQFEAGDSVPAQKRNKVRIARHLQDQGKFDQARGYLEGLESSFRSMDNRPALIDALTLNAADARHRGDLGSAQRRLRRALKVAAETGSPSLVGRSELALCEFGVETGPQTDTAAQCKSAAERFEKLDMPHLAARGNAKLAELLHAKGDLNKAGSHYSKAIRSLKKTGVRKADEKSAMTNYRANLCQVEMSLRSNGAHHLCRKALEALDNADEPDPSMLAATHYALGVTAGRAWREEKGIEHLEKAAELAESQPTPNKKLASDAHLRRGVMFADKKKDYDAAKRAFRRGLALTDDADELAGTRVQLHTQLAQVELSLEDWKEARSLLEELVKADAADTQTKAWAYSALARASSKLDDPDAAKKALESGLPLAKQAGNKELVESIEDNLENFDE